VLLVSTFIVLKSLYTSLCCTREAVFWDSRIVTASTSMPLARKVSFQRVLGEDLTQYVLQPIIE